MLRFRASIHLSGSVPSLSSLFKSNQPKSSLIFRFISCTQASIGPFYYSLHPKSAATVSPHPVQTSFSVYRCLSIELSPVRATSSLTSTLKTPTESTKATSNRGATQSCPPSQSTPTTRPATILLHPTDRLFLLLLLRYVLRSPPRPQLLVLAPPLAQASQFHSPTRLPYHHPHLNP